MDQESKEYLSVSEFAFRVGKTTSAMYQQMKGKLKGYVKEGADGKTVIAAEALSLYGVKPDSAKPPVSDKEIEENKGEAKRLKKENEDLAGEVSRLRGDITQLTEKNRSLKELCSKKEEENVSLSSEVARLTAEVARLNLEKEHLQEKLTMTEELSRERSSRLYEADQRINSLLEKIPPMLPPASNDAGSGGLFGGLFKKKRNG